MVPSQRQPGPCLLQIKAVAERVIYDQDVAIAALGDTQNLPDYTWCVPPCRMCSCTQPPSAGIFDALELPQQLLFSSSTTTTSSQSMAFGCVAYRIHMPPRTKSGMPC